MTSSLLAVQEQLSALKEIYASGLPEKLERMAQAWQHAALAWGDEIALETLHRAAHSLAGSGASLGFARLSEEARELELCLQAVIERDARFTQPEIRHVETLLSTLRRAAAEPDRADEPDQAILPQVAARPQNIPPALASNEEKSSTRAESPVWARPPVQPRYATRDETKSKVVYLYEEDADLAQDMAVQIGHFGYDVHTFSCCADLQAASARLKPIAVISDIASPDSDIELVSMKEGEPPATIFVSAHDDMKARLLAVRAGGVAYFTKPASVDSIVNKLDQIAAPQDLDPFRILIVDDEPELARYHASILENAGMLTTVISDPMLTLTALVESKPDLILMDMHMPGCMGIELAAVIRQQEAYVSVPIVYLSAETDVDKQMAAMRLGGDSFLTKPIRPEHLVSAVCGRVERLRVLRSFMVRDSLTGLFNHTVLKEQLSLEVARTARAGADMSLVMVDIDHFKRVNDTYGHPTGDQVIKSISRLLQQRLRKSDVVGRYGGEEFVIILPNTEEGPAVKLMDRLREGFSQVRHQSEAGDFYVTFSAGVASFSHFAGANELNNAADRALYKAKASGRNRVVAAGRDTKGE
ncbi:MAG: diguanylate cyclase [Chloroflexota bacterium]|nr:diguanylate cyclase [Chloroflexota bacterium]